MNKKTLIIISLLSYLIYLQNFRQEKSNTLISSYKETVSWRQFPITLQFHKNFPKDKKHIAELEIHKFNELAGFIAIEIDPRLSDSKIFNTKDGNNVISWNDSKQVRFNSSEQAKTSSYWYGNIIEEADIKINSSLANSKNIDFASLFRHELCHAMGMRHQKIGLMSPHLPENSIKEWDHQLIKLWVSDLKKEHVNGIESNSTSLSSTLK